MISPDRSGVSLVPFGVQFDRGHGSIPEEGAELASFSQVRRIRSASEAALRLVRSDFPDYHPLIALARLAHRSDVIDDPRLELEVHKTILPYVAPRLASAEEPNGSDDDRSIVVTLFDDAELEDGRSVPVEVPLLVEDAREIVRAD